MGIAAGSFAATALYWLTADVSALYISLYSVATALATAFVSATLWIEAGKSEDRFGRCLLRGLAIGSAFGLLLLGTAQSALLGVHPITIAMMPIVALVGCALGAIAGLLSWPLVAFIHKTTVGVST